MAKKRTRIDFATISVAAYRNGKKCSNTFNWKVFAIDERNVGDLFEKERVKIEQGIAEQYYSQYPHDGAEIIAKISKTERHYADSFVANDITLIGTSGETKGTLKIQG